MARLIGEAYIVIYPSADGFGPKAEAEVKKALARVRPKVPVAPELDKKAEAAVEAGLKAIKGRDVNITPVLDPAALARIRGILDSILGADAKIKPYLDQARLNAILAELQSINDKVDLGIALDPADVAKVESELAALTKSAETKVMLDPMMNEVLWSRLKGLWSQLHSPELLPTMNQADLQRIEDLWQKLTEKRTLGLVVDPADLVRLEQQIRHAVDMATKLASGDMSKMLAPLPFEFNAQNMAEQLQKSLGGVLLRGKGIPGISAVEIPVMFNPATIASATKDLENYLSTGVTTVRIPVRFDQATILGATKQLNSYLQHSGIVTAQIPARLNPASLPQMSKQFIAWTKTGILTAQVPVRFNAAQIAAANNVLRTYMNTHPAQLQITTTAAMAKVAAFGAYMRRALRAATLNTLNLGPALVQFVTLRGMVASLQATFAKLGNSANVTKAALASAGAVGLTSFIQGANGAAGAITGLQNHIVLFAGIFDKILPAALSRVTVWHVAADAILEFAAVFVPATIAVVSWGAAALPVFLDAYHRLTAMRTAASALGVTIGIFNYNAQGAVGPMQKLQNALQPTVWQLTGDAVTVLTSKTGAFSKIVMAVNTVIQDLAARMTAAFTSQGFNSFMKNGALDAQRFGTMIGNLGGAFGNLIKDVPGYAEIIQELLTKISAGIEYFTAIAGPILKAGMALHGFFLYVGLATTAGVALLAGIGNVIARFFTFATAATSISAIGLRLGTSFKAAGAAISGFGKNLLTLISNPYVIAIAAIGLAAYEIVSNFNSATAAVTNFVNTLMTKISTMQGGAALQAIPNAMKQISVEIQQASSPQAYQQIKSNWMSLSNTGNAFSKDMQAVGSQLGQAFKSLFNVSGSGGLSNVIGFFTHLGDAAKSFVRSNAAGAIIQQVDNVKLLENAFNKLSGYQQNLYRVTAQLMTGQTGATHATFNFAQSLGILDAAGVQAGDSLQTMEIKVKGMLTGWQQYGLTATQIGNSVNALALQTEMGQTGISKLTGAYTNFIQVVTGGETAFSAFGNGLGTLSQALSTAGAKGVTFTNTLGKFRVTGTAVGATMNGLSQASLGVRSAFAAEVGNATTLYNSLLTMASVSASGAHGQHLLAQAGKDMVATMLPLAQHSKSALAELSALAQLAGGPATTSYQKLARWVGNVKNPMQNLNKIEQQLTVSSANLLKDTQNLAGAMGDTLTSAIAGALFAAEKGPQALQALATSMANLVNGKGSVSGVETQLAKFIPALKLMSGSAANAKDVFLSMAAGLHISQAAALQMWNAVTQGNSVIAQNVAATAHMTAANKANEAALMAIPLTVINTTSAYNQLFTALQHTDNGLVNGVGTTKLAQQAFINFAEQGLKMTAKQADTLWKTNAAQNLTALASKAGTTQQAFVNLAHKGLGISDTQAKQLWATLRMQYLDTLVAKGNSAQGAFMKLAEQGFGLAKSDAQALWNELRNQYLDTLAAKAGETKSAFEKTAAEFGIARTAAQKLWDQLHAMPKSVPINVPISVQISQAVASGTSPAVAQQVAQSLQGMGLQEGGVVHAARGYTVRGRGPSGKDSTMIMAAPGELVIPTSHAPAFRDHARRAGIPGFASGGSVPGYAGGGMPEPVFGYGSYSGTPYSFANGAPQWVSKTGTVASAPGLPPMTQSQGQQLISLLQQQNKLLAQMPYSQATAITQAGGSGVRRGYFATSG